MSTAFSCCLCFVLSLACNDKPQVTYNISGQRNTQLAVLCTGRAQFHEHKWWATRGSKEKTHIFIYLKYRLSWMSTHLFIFSIARWSIYFCGVPVNHSPLHARTQQYALLRNKNKTKQKKYPWKLSQHRDKNAEQIFFRFQLNFMIKPEYSFKQTQF